MYNSDSALYLVSVELAGSSFGVEAEEEGNRLSEILVPIRKTARGKILANRNLRMNYRENFDYIYIIVYSLYNSSFFASTFVVVAVFHSNLNRVTGYPNSNWSCIFSEFHMNALIRVQSKKIPNFFF